MILYKNGYEPYIDFLKGYMILCVLFVHASAVWGPLCNYSLFFLWGCAPTGCFMLISTMHHFRHGLREAKFSLPKQLKNVLFPFLILQTLIIIGVIGFKSVNHFDYDKIIYLIQSGGYGVGSYFPWVYIQYILLMALLTPIIRRIKNKRILLLFFLALSVLIEYLCCHLQIDDRWYRILVMRFPFLIYLGLILDEEGLKITKSRAVFSVIGFVFIVIFVYGNVNLEPFFYYKSWKAYHWVCYPYLAFFLTFMVYQIYKKTEGSKFSKMMLRIGKASYGIFLFQAMWYLLPYSEKNVIMISLYVIVSMIICTVCGILLKEKVLDRVL